MGAALVSTSGTYALVVEVRRPGDDRVVMGARLSAWAEFERLAPGTTVTAALRDVRAANGQADGVAEFRLVGVETKVTREVLT